VPAVCRHGVFVRGPRIGSTASEVMDSTFRAVLSPCIGVCMLDDDGLCMGCRRTTAEIARWPQMGDDERLHLMEHVLPMRAAQTE
jgi:predicted Fe-S protein YdhL (DUF1289 family)